MKTNRFLMQTSKDYDIPLIVVKRIYEEYKGLDFYKALEQVIIDRK